MPTSSQSHDIPIDLTGPYSNVWNQVYTSQNTVVQAMGLDVNSNVVYTAQIIQDGVQLPDEPAPVPYTTRRDNGDIAITQLSRSGSILGVMYARGAGHGVSMGIEYDDHYNTWLWIDCDASGSGFARALRRVQFQNNLIMDRANSYPGSTVYRPFGPAGGSHGLSVAIDSVNGMMCVRRTFPDPDNGFGRRYYIYKLSDAVANNWTEVAHFDQDANRPAGTPGANGTFQGMCLYRSWVYVLDGDPKTVAPDDVYMTCTHWATGVMTQQIHVTAHSDFTYREPETMSVLPYVDSIDQSTFASISFGFANGPDNGRNFTYDVYGAQSAIPM